METEALDALLVRLAGLGLVGSGGRQCTAWTHVLGRLRSLNRLELVGQSVRAALEALAAAAPGWLATVVDDSWAGVYGSRIDELHLPESETKRNALVVAYGGDGYRLLGAVYATDAPAWLRELPAVQVLRVMLLQNYLVTTDATGREVLRAREGRHGRSPARQSASELPVWH